MNRLALNETLCFDAGFAMIETIGPTIFDERPPARPKKSATVGLLMVILGGILVIGGAWALYTSGTEFILSEYSKWQQLRRSDEVDRESKRQYYEKYGTDEEKRLYAR